ncbi:MAG: hypothetical protein KDA93_15400 [Planctomycetaceae bacterium]|nr:hypothetical protein [Planctomycetaceae bacterium]
MASARQRIALLSAIALLVVAIGVGPFLKAEGETDEPSLTQVERPQKVIVLETGRVILGDIVDRPGGYLVKERFGSAVIPYGKVRVTAADLPDAYRKLKLMATNPTAGTHLALAKWCRDNRLYGSAKFEIKQALLLEPERKDARQFLRELEQELEHGSPAGQGTVGVERGPIERATEAEFPGQPWKARLHATKEVFEPQQPESTAGLTPELVQSFVREVQPILLNKCGNAQCHGQASTNEFRLANTHRGMSGFRIFTERNISSVLLEIDPQEPSNSPILIEAFQPNHGETPKPIFSGRSADLHRAALKKWVEGAAAEELRKALVKGEAPQKTSPEQEDQPIGPLQDSFLEGILAEDHPDQFSPDEFNRLVHQASGQFGSPR